MEERRKIKQIEIKDENGNLEYTVIPNYRMREDFMSKNEIKFYKFLIRVVLEIKEKYNVKLTIFAQVALNRIIDVNNDRNKSELFDKISRKSIDFVLYDESKNSINCCIELDDSSHGNSDRQERDLLLDRIFKNNIKLLHIKTQDYYDLDDIINKII